jgi:hypothetical protein
MGWTHRLGTAAAAVMLLSVPAMALMLTAAGMPEPQASELLAATAAASLVRDQVPAAATAAPDVAFASPVTLTEWKFTGGCCFSPTHPKGDMNFDGVVNGLDVDPFVETLLSGSTELAELYAADTNGDCVVNGLDVDPFLALLMSPSP